MTPQSNNCLVSGSRIYPLLPGHAPDDIVAWQHDTAVTRETLLRDVRSIAGRLPDGRYAINLCENRYWFLAGFIAVLMRGQTCLLPPGRAPRVIEEIVRDHAGACCLSDTGIAPAGAPLYRIDALAAAGSADCQELAAIPGEQLAAIVFTSGSTGRARPHRKYWEDLVTGAGMMQQRFGFGARGRHQSIVATVPPQHMYGLETSILNPLLNAVSIFTGNTFFPADINKALGRVPAPGILVTTPIHLKFCLDSGLSWPAIDYVISATAPLDPALARRAEEVLCCPVFEIYGCTEAGSIASRRTIEGDYWTLYEHSGIRKTRKGHSVTGPNLPEAVPLHDVIVPVNDRQFTLHGRFTDMINIAGKRASLEDLNIRIRSIEGVVDAAFLVPEQDGVDHARLVAFVIAPGCSREYIRRELALRIDPVFLPRPLHMVDDLPRTGTGKLPRTALLELLDHVRNTG